MPFLGARLAPLTSEGNLKADDANWARKLPDPQNTLRSLLSKYSRQATGWLRKTNSSAKVSRGFGRLCASVLPSISQRRPLADPLDDPIRTVRAGYHSFRTAPFRHEAFDTRKHEAYRSHAAGDYSGNRYQGSPRCTALPQQKKACQDSVILR